MIIQIQTPIRPIPKVIMTAISNALKSSSKGFL